jgi:hypothetical protein
VVLRAPADSHAELKLSTRQGRPLPHAANITNNPRLKNLVFIFAAFPSNGDDPPSWSEVASDHGFILTPNVDCNVMFQPFCCRVDSYFL